MTEITNITHTLIKRLTDTVSELENDFIEISRKYHQLLDFIKTFSGGVHHGNCLDLGLRAENLLEEIGE